jgi:hypothetical protein
VRVALHSTDRDGDRGSKTDRKPRQSTTHGHAHVGPAQRARHMTSTDLALIWRQGCVCLCAQTRNCRSNVHLGFSQPGMDEHDGAPGTDRARCGIALRCCVRQSRLWFAPLQAMAAPPLPAAPTDPSLHGVAPALHASGAAQAT